jgi:hypothetical protein
MWPNATRMTRIRNHDDLLLGEALALHLVFHLGCSEAMGKPTSKSLQLSGGRSPALRINESVSGGPVFATSVAKAMEVMKAAPGRLPAVPGSGTEGFFEVVEQVVECLDGGGVGGLLALHGGDDDLVAEGGFSR